MQQYLRGVVANQRDMQDMKFSYGAMQPTGQSFSVKIGGYFT